MHRLFDGVVGVSARTVDVGDRMADRAGDSRPCGRMTLQVILGIIESLLVIKGAAEKRNRVMAAGAEA